MPKTEPVITMRGVKKSFPGALALKGVDFTLQKGEIHALLGENGAGKSTLIKILTGVHERDQGEILLDGAPIHPRNPQDAQKIGISCVHQEINLCPNLTVAENIFIGREPMRFGAIDWRTANKKSYEIMKGFGLDIDVTKTADSYSAAVQQMVVIARATEISAKVLVLDEPTSSLTAVEAKKLFDTMRALKEKGAGIIFVTHFLDQVYEVADTITILRGGEYVGTYAASELPKVQLVGKMIGKEYKELDEATSRQGSASVAGEPFLSVEGASSSEIANVSLVARKEEVLGLSGLLGSGRTEIARMIFGVDPALAGAIKVKGKKVKIKSALSAMRLGMGFCPEERKKEGIIGDLSIRENIVLALQAKRGIFHLVPRAEAERLADEYIEKLAIKTPSREQSIKNLSGGNQQKAIVARWLASNPELLILDEPTRGIDIGAKAELQKLVITLAGGGMAIIFISSEIDEMLRCCQRMVVLRDKEIAGELDGDISENRIMSFIAGGADSAKS